MGSLDNFKPAGGVQVNAFQLSGPSGPPGGVPIGRPNGQYVQPILQQGQQQVIQQPVGGTAMFGGGAPAGAPKGAQPVSLVGSPIMAGNAPRLPMSPQGQQQALQGPKTPSDTEVHIIKVEGKGLDGKTYVAEFEAMFPRGTKVMGVTEVEPG
jgi:hypothetical protein